MALRPQQPGLQAERTLLSWERSALGFLVGGVLLMIRQHGPFGPGRAVLALIAAGLALSVLAVGHRRAQVIRRGHAVPEPAHLPAAHAEVVWIGTATAVFAVVIVGVLIASTLFG
ncbi:DUF202 domain-containing protein [Mycolicibacterium bacteremicum]|uniref:DUF202 domain-containing protein n=1 Tax=Mycolicibacterium bacteremicum TaxID=564198 RepID=A0A1W9YQX3_MYCBA|nr:DUF202 domain-containing protein [Mycolicibacterium bacteremicum]MCV7433422.1 DUF202 domain-containing protein [Mycolicibacterium bacteremicum]ORA02455.1 hypothetical protein BST17_23250 [Mycolicibacterium bacteremicum]